MVSTGKNSRQIFKIAGISTINGVTKVRWTNDMVRRIKQFTKRGVTRCDLVELPHDMLKIDALRYIKNHEMFQSVEDQAVIAEALADREKWAARDSVTVTKNKNSDTLAELKSRARRKKDGSNSETVDNLSV